MMYYFCVCVCVCWNTPIGYILIWAFWVALVVKNPSAHEGDTEMQVPSLGQEGLLEEGTAICSSILAWKILRTEEPGRLEFIGLQRVGHN